jgi:hypothetical protein
MNISINYPGTRNIIAGISLSISVFFGCSDPAATGLSDLNKKNFICMAYECHQGTLLKIYPPASGLHGKHTSLGGDGGGNFACTACHYKYYTNPLHRNGIINGFDWRYNLSMPGNIVIFDLNAPGINSGIKYNKSTGDCTSIGCHGNQNWYSGG